MLCMAIHVSCSVPNLTRFVILWFMIILYCRLKFWGKEVECYADASTTFTILKVFEMLWIRYFYIWDNCLCRVCLHSKGKKEFLNQVCVVQINVTMIYWVSAADRVLQMMEMSTEWRECAFVKNSGRSAVIIALSRVHTSAKAGNSA